MVREADAESQILSTPIQEVLRRIKALPYADMKQFADKLAESFEEQEGNNDSIRMAEALSEVAQKQIDSAATTVEDGRLLTKVFSRKRQISVERISSGWKVGIPSTGAAALGHDLRKTISDLLDQVVVARVLQGDKK